MNGADACTFADLQSAEHSFIQWDHDIRDLAEMFGCLPENVSGMVLTMDNGEIREVWVSGSTRPFDLTAAYTKIH